MQAPLAGTRSGRTCFEWCGGCGKRATPGEAGKSPRLADRVARFRTVGLSDSIARQFAERALALRYDRPELAPIRAEQLLEIRRREDAGNDLWSITNRLGENLLRGGMRDTSRVNQAGKPFRPKRAIRGLAANVAINIGIWTLRPRREGNPPPFPPPMRSERMGGGEQSLPGTQGGGPAS